MPIILVSRRLRQGTTLWQGHLWVTIWRDDSEGKVGKVNGKRAKPLKEQEQKSHPPEAGQWQ